MSRSSLSSSTSRMASIVIGNARLCGLGDHVLGKLEQSCTQHTFPGRVVGSCAYKYAPSVSKEFRRKDARPHLAAVSYLAQQHLVDSLRPLKARRSRRQRCQIQAFATSSGSSSDEGELPNASESKLPGGQRDAANEKQNGGLLTSSKRRLAELVEKGDAILFGKEPVKDYGFFGELLASFKVLIRMGPVSALGLILLQAFLWFLQETAQVAIVKLIRKVDPPALIIVNKLSVYTAIFFLLANMLYLSLATGLSITAVTRAVAATFSKRRLTVKDILRDWWKHARQLAVAQLKVYWPLLLLIVYAGLNGDKLLDDTRTKQLEIFHEMKILNRLNSLTLIALYPGLRLLRIASWFTYFFYSLTVIPLLGLAGPAILLEDIASKQALHQRRLSVRGFPMYRLLPLLVPLAIMSYFTFFVKASLPINALTIAEWSHQVWPRLGKAAGLTIAGLIQVLLYISYRRKKEEGAFSSLQLGEYLNKVGSGQKREEGDGGSAENVPGGA